MKQTTKDGRSWYSHKTPDGRWDTGKSPYRGKVKSTVRGGNRGCGPVRPAQNGPTAAKL